MAHLTSARTKHEVEVRGDMWECSCGAFGGAPGDPSLAKLEGREHLKGHFVPEAIG